MSSQIPKARAILAALAEALEDLSQPGLGRLATAGYLRTVLPLLKRSPPVSKTRPKSKPMSPVLAVAICHLHQVRPELSHQELADRFEINTGRVSEALNGKWNRQGAARFARPAETGLAAAPSVPSVPSVP
jgi:hypothetical protein